MIRELVAADVDWMVAETARRRALLVPHAPRFWRRAADATERHRDHLAALVADPATLTLRSDRAFLVALDGGDHRMVDDAVVAEGGTWDDEGAALLRHVLALGPVRLVAPVPEPDRAAVAEGLGMRPAEVWWHRDLPAAPRTAGDSGDPTVAVAGAVGRLVPAPPVYDPGGPVVLVVAVQDRDALTAVEIAAAVRGATVSVVTQDPADEARAALLAEAGYVRTTVFVDSADR